MDQQGLMALIQMLSQKGPPQQEVPPQAPLPDEMMNAPHMWEQKAKEANKVKAQDTLSRILSYMYDPIVKGYR